MIEVKSLTPAATDEASIKEYLACCVSVVRNKHPKDNDRLFERLMKESAGNKPSRVFEFIPCGVIGLDMLVSTHSARTFGFLEETADGVIYRTTARELLNLGWSWDEVLRHVDFTDYRTVQLKVPYFIYGQLSTHTQITSVSHSARYSESGMGYWMPDEVRSHLMSNIGCSDVEEAQRAWDEVVMHTSPKVLQNFIRDTCGIKRREVWARGSDMLAYRTSTLGGYISDDHAWPHFFLQRAHDLHTQKETRKVAMQIEETLFDV